jgi:prepilin-type N-terminal cleavage/methylation domain-containing protein
MNHPKKSSSTKVASMATGFTMIEILIVLTIVSILAAALGVTINNMMTSAREAQTTATLRKVDGLLVERQQGLQRAFESRDFIRYVDTTHEKLIKGDPTNNVPQLYGLSQNAVEAVARKDFARQFFPQRFVEMLDIRDPGLVSPTNPRGLTPDANSDGVPDGDGAPDRIQFDDVYGEDATLVTWTGGPVQSPTNHDPRTESSELLYFALTRMEVLGTPLTAVDDFSTREVADTDNDGLPEFIDGWGNPLRYYRWPTRLFKPYGLFGADGVPGDLGDDTDSPPGADFDDLYEIGWPGTDDVVIPTNVRNFARAYIAGLPRAPVLSGGLPIPGDYDQLNIDPDDSFGILLHTAQPLAAQGINMLNSISESRYHTLDTYHRPLVVSTGADGILGLYEPNHNEDLNFNGILDSGEDVNGNGFLDIGFLGQPINEDASFDDLTNHNRRAGE